MPRLSTQGGFDEELLAKAKEELSGNLEFSEQQEPLNRNKAGMPSISGFIEQHFDFRQCSRGAGDTYGIADSKKCRQGADMGTGSKAKEEKKGSSKSGGGGKMSDDEKKDLQVKASKGDKAAMKALNDARAAGKIGKESGIKPKSDTPPLRPDGSVNTSAKKSKSETIRERNIRRANEAEARLKKLYGGKTGMNTLTADQVRAQGKLD